MNPMDPIGIKPTPFNQLLSPAYSCMPQNIYKKTACPDKKQPKPEVKATTESPATTKPEGDGFGAGPLILFVLIIVVMIAVIRSKFT